MKILDYKPMIDYTKAPDYKNPVISWLMGDVPPTRLEAILCIAGLVTCLFWIVWGVTA